jgi:hypothetical protein
MNLMVVDLYNDLVLKHPPPLMQCKVVLYGLYHTLYPTYIIKKKLQFKIGVLTN